jgi:methionyl-tRNA formyltransferase
MTAPLRVVYMGSPDFAATVFEAVADRYEILAAVTQPDRPAGRGRKLTPPPVKVAAQARDIPVLQPTAIKTATFREQLASLRADVAVVAAYGRILPGAVLETPRLGTYNVHASLLPWGRGAAPIQWSIIDGLNTTGVTIMRLDEGMDTGDIALQRTLDIEPGDTAGSLAQRLAVLGSDAMVEALERLAAQTLPLTPQDEGAATVARLLTKGDGRLDWTARARRVSGRARGVDPWPGAHARWGDQTVKLFGPTVVEGAGAPGELLGPDDEYGLRVACGDGAVAFAQVQLPGRKRLPAAAVLAGQKLQVGDVLT